MTAQPSVTMESAVRTLVRETVREVLREELPERRNAPAMTLSEDTYMSVTKAARVADVTPGTIRKWIRTGRLTSKHAGRVLRVSRLELERFMRNEATGPNGAEMQRRTTHLFGHQKPLRRQAA